MVKCVYCGTETDGNILVTKANGKDAEPVCSLICGMNMCGPKEDVLCVPAEEYESK